ncbi:hypothetical protein [Schleiferia thermophila]|jgi:hypothetical protein|uniref:Uncharacterized protein n=1 Tax=Schleiferia thermophila TaxID=884107 RepID=A0A368ZYV4_9FLAO|nr:hypothetical protein [Schleiferia thermophila]KFD38123.1 hypothetical protein AT05_11645 [Schleiferia thermophila str. Yellowstone]RCX02141.1 hypothetical protein DES35_105112 [Schleiferia thermophila]GCD80662.1 hypothetical protein JCM30197_19090 [Schleiferia thermophila]
MSRQTAKEYELRPLLKLVISGLVFIVCINALFYNKKHYTTLPDQLHYTQSSLLYFKNVRSYYFDVRADTPSGFLMYSFRRLKKALKPDEMDVFLIINPIAETAYLYPNFETYRKKELILASLLVEKDTLLLFPRDAAELKGVFMLLREKLIDGKKIALLINSEVVVDDMYSNRKSRKALIQLIDDYLKLTSAK